MLHFQCLLIRDFIHFSQKKALLKRLFWSTPSAYFQPNLAISLYHHLVAANVNCTRADRRSKSFASEIPSPTTKANIGYSPKHCDSFVHL